MREMFPEYYWQSQNYFCFLEKILQKEMFWELF